MLSEEFPEDPESEPGPVDLIQAVGQAKVSCTDKTRKMLTSKETSLS